MAAVLVAASAVSAGNLSDASVVGNAASVEAYSCGVNGNAVSGTFGDAGLIGWAGDNGVVACLGGSFYVKSGSGTTATGSFTNLGTSYGFGVYNYAKTTWVNADGYLPALVTSFVRGRAEVSITNFADRDIIGGDAFEVVYSRVAVHNPVGHTITVDPDPSPGLVALDAAPDRVPAGTTVDHDYAVAASAFGGTYPLPTGAALRSEGSFAEHFAHMRAFWNNQLSHIAQLVQLPDQSLVDAYKAGFIDTQIIRDGDELFSGANGYTQEYSHDVIGILANLFTQGDFSDAHALLERADYVVGTQSQYADGLWTYTWPWAIYLETTGDLSFVKQHFATPGPLGPAEEPSIEATAHDIGADRTGPGGIMEETNDIDADGYWTIDNYEALMGLAAYRYLAVEVGDQSEVAWATSEYDSLLHDVNKTVDATLATYHLSYLPCSMVEPNADNRCANAEDGNWAATFLFGRWAWDGYLFAAPLSGPGISLIDATYDYGLGRLSSKLPADTFGGYSPDFWSTAYNAGYGSWGLASVDHRDQGILSYEFLIADDQSGPYSWWESSAAPNPGSPWVGTHPTSGNGASPHAWGIANANMVLLGSLVAQRSTGQLIVGRGVPSSWITTGKDIVLDNMPTTDGHRIGLRMTTLGHTVTLRLTGHPPAGAVLFQLPVFVDDIASATVGVINESTGTVTLAASTRTVSVTLRHTP